MTDWPGKSAAGPEEVEHPAVYHMLDVAAVAERLTEPAPLSPRLRAAVVLFSALHDLGKIGEPFRAMLREGAVQVHGRHWEVTEILLRRHDDLLAPRLGGKSRRWALYAACAGHHGGPPLREGRDLERMERATGQRAISLRQTSLVRSDRVFPARAGMTRPGTGKRAHSHGVPRASGDDPMPCRRVACSATR